MLYVPPAVISEEDWKRSSLVKSSNTTAAIVREQEFVLYLEILSLDLDHWPLLFIAASQYLLS